MNKKMVSTILALSTLSTAAIHLWNRIQFTFQLSKEFKDYQDIHFYDWRFGKVRYATQGEGTPLLLIHDLKPGSSSYEFHRIYDALSKTNEVYVIDLLGYGFSDKPNMTYTNYLYVQLIVDFIKNIIGRKANVMATGDSAATAIMACHNDPEFFENIYLINPQKLNILNTPPTHNTKLLKFFIEIPIIGTFIYNILTSKNNFRTALCNHYFFDKSFVKEDYVTAYCKASHYPDYNAKYTYSSYIGRYINSNILHALKEINHCIYILYGNQEDAIELNIENYVSFNHAIEKASIDNASHLPHLEQPIAFLKQLEIFL